MKAALNLNLFQENETQMKQLVGTLHQRTQGIIKGGDDKAIKKHTSKGKLLVRDRINLLLDKSSAFLELSTLAAYDMYGGNINAAGIITGIGKIHGYFCTKSQFFFKCCGCISGANV
jgi:3-methylcrotonyl-CoA carboxylase beta subunit